MPTNIDTHATEKSTYIVTAAFTDEDGAAVSPATLTWTLTDSSGSVINSREDVAVSDPGTSEDIVLSGADLGVTETGDVVRIITFEGTYNHVDHGNGLALTGSARFVVDNLKAVT